MDSFTNGTLRFDVDDYGPSDGPVVVLLHGFPQFADSWQPVATRLAAAGYRCLVPDQRGYSPGARPGRRRDYRMPLLVEDVRALVAASGAQRVHLVGHDWGAVVAWAFAHEHPQRLASLTPVSVAHPAAFLRAFGTSRQALASWYVFAFQLPYLPERALVGGRRSWHALSQRLQDSGQTAGRADRDAQRMGQDGTLTAALNWYRASLLVRPGDYNAPTTVPTMFAWGDQDKFCMPAAAHATGRFVSAAYRFEAFAGASHWLPEEQAPRMSAALLEHLAAHPA